jgi:lysophospholipase L1-like esterase
MLFFLGQDRSYLSEEIKIEGILRILCVGDSMTYGQGCLITETFPFQLEKILNSVFWNEQVEVINAGICGYSIYDAWNRYLDKFLRFKPDLVIVTICDNDAELYNHRETTNEREVQMNYIEFSETCYDPKGEHFPYFRLLLKDIAQHVHSQGTPVLIAFYDIHGGLHREQIMPLITEACQNSGLPFADLSEDFLDTAAATHNKLLKVSESDAHPSAIAHEIAARRLARFILKHNVLPRSSKVLTSEPEMIQNCLTRVEQMVKFGVDPGKAFFFFKRSLSAKRDSRLRLQLPDENLLNDAGYQQVLTSLNTTWRYFIALSVWQSYYLNFRVDIEQFNFGLRLCDMALSRLAKTLFVLEKLLADLSLPIVYTFETIFNQRIKSGEQDFDALAERLTQWKKKHISAQAFAKQTLETLENKETIFLPISSTLLIDKLEVLECQIKALWSEAEAIINTAEKHLACYSMLAKKITQSNHDNLLKTLTRAYWLLDDTLEQFDFCLTAMCYNTLSLLSQSSKYEIENCLTLVQVSLTAPEYQKTFSNSNDELLSLEIKVKSFAPFNYIICDIQTIIRDGLPHLYCFQVSFFLDGEIWLGIKSGQEVKVNTVRLSNAKDKSKVLEPKDLIVENEGQVYRSPRIFVPL